MKFSNTELKILNTDSFEEKLRSFCYLNRYKLRFTWNQFSCGTFVITGSITGFKRNNDSERGIVYTVYNQTKCIKCISDDDKYREAKEQMSKIILKDLDVHYD